MKRILAVDWDRREVRFVLATAKGGTLRVRAAEAVPLPETDVDFAGPHPKLGRTLREALAKEKIGRAVTLVGIDRASVELLQLTLPPAQNSELPRLVDNEILRESATTGERAIVDFVALDDDPSQPRRVTAAILDSDRLEQIQAACAEAGLNPKAIVLRSHASAALFLRRTSPSEKVLLLVNAVADEVDLTVVQEQKPVLSRTARLPGAIGDEKADERLLAEINRTLTVVNQGETGSAPVEGIYFFGNASEQQHLVDRIGRESMLPTKTFDPFDLVDARKISGPGAPQRFVALLGMVSDEAQGAAHAVDFLHPRRPPKPLDRRRVTIFAAAAVAVVLVAGTYLAWDAVAAVNAQNAVLAGRLKQLHASVTRAAKQRQLIDSILRWKAGEVIWLEELRELSTRFPGRRDAVILRMSMSSAPAGGGTMSFNGLVRESPIVVRMESSLRDAYHEVYSNRVGEGPSENDYARRFNALIHVSRRSKQTYIENRAGP